MTKVIIDYFFNGVADKAGLMEKIVADENLKNEFVDYQMLLSVIGWIYAKGNSDEVQRSLGEFLNKHEMRFAK